MTTYIVTDKTTGAETYRYAASTIMESLNGVAVPLTEFDHTEFVEGVVDVVPNSYTWTKREYLSRFTQIERIAIRETAKTVPALEDYLELLALAEEVRSNDPDVVAALTMLEASGLIGAGRAAEILSGE